MPDRRYSQGDIDRIISSGSIKQKSRLYIRDRMGYFGQGFILTYEDIDRLVLSVEAWKREEWNEFVSLGLRLENGFKDMRICLDRVKDLRNNLVRTLSEIHDFEKLELLLNRILDPVEGELWDSVGDPDSLLSDIALSHLRDKGIELDGFRLISPRLDPSNHIDLRLSGKGTIRDRAGVEKNLLRREMTFYLCYEVAIRRRISELNLVIPEYDSLLNKNREVVEQPVSMSLRWEGVQDNRTFQIGETDLKDRDPQDHPFPSLMRMIEDFSVRVKDIDLDSEENIELINKLYSQI